MRFGLSEILIIAIVILVLFGGKLIPKLGEKVRESRDALKEEVERTKGERE